MKIKNNIIKTGAAFLFVLLMANVCFAQQAQKTETVIYKLVKNQYEGNEKALHQSLSQLNGIIVNKFCDVSSKIFVILQVDRTLQPNDNNIISTMSALNIGYKPIESSENQDVLSFCN